MCSVELHPGMERVMPSGEMGDKRKASFNKHMVTILEAEHHKKYEKHEKDLRGRDQ